MDFQEIAPVVVAGINPAQSWQEMVKALSCELKGSGGFSEANLPVTTPDLFSPAEVTFCSFDTTAGRTINRWVSHIGGAPQFIDPRRLIQLALDHPDLHWSRLFTAWVDQQGQWWALALEHWLETKILRIGRIDFGVTTMDPDAVAVVQKSTA